MFYRSLLIFLTCLAAQNVFCQYTLSGHVFEEKTKNPIGYASVVINDIELWAITNESGGFLIKNVSKGNVKITVSCLGYVKRSYSVDVSDNTNGLIFYLPLDNLALKEVVVTAQNKSDDATSSHVIDRAGLDHLQMQGVSDVMGLLPGGQTNRVQTLATSDPQTIALRSASSTSEYGNTSFGTAIEVDGVRLSNNAFVDPNTSSSSKFSGTDTRNIASSNIESVELITGIPSVAYGDMSNGIVKINTRKGKSPYIIEMATNPNTKLFSLSKGFGLGKNAGTLNANLEKTNSISDPASPYTTYQRNSMSLLYENTFNRYKQPLTLTFGVTGNIGGYDNEADPDLFVNTYTKTRDNTYRIQAGMNYLLNKPYLTNLELGATYDYSDNLSKVNTNQSHAVPLPVLHGQTEGYFASTSYDENPNAAVLLSPTGYYYYEQLTDNKPITFTGNLKARLVKKIGSVSNNFMLGANFSRTGNKGKGVYYDNLQNAPDWREYRYDLLPYMNNMAVFLEDKANIRINKSVLQLVAGIRSDMTMIKGSAYGTVSSFSPRFNAKYTFPENKENFVENLSLRAGWGKAVKLPSFSTLYPEPVYTDKQSFSSGDYYAYFILPRLPRYNPDLRWQYSNQAEFGIDTRLKGVDISISVYDSKTLNAYQNSNYYDPYTYKFTNPTVIGDNFPIPAENRQFSTDQTTGIVTVSDKTGQEPSVVLPYTNYNTFNSNTYLYPINGSPSVRRGVEWTVDFGKIEALQTSIRWDGNYYYYKGLDETITPYMPNSTIKMSGGGDIPYQYIAFYPGGNGVGNGTEMKQLHSNLTFTAHIPAVRFIVSLRIESSLYNKTQNLSEYNGQPLGFVLDNNGDYFPSTTATNIYAGNQFVGKYPLYYISYDDMNTKIPFAQALLNAKNNGDTNLYNDLTQLVSKTNFNDYFNPQKLSAYAFASINVTKEIGNFVSISFNAINFLNTLQLVKSSQTNLNTSLYGSSNIPGFFYGLSLKLKL